MTLETSSSALASGPSTAAGSENRPGGQRFIFLDGLRGIASLMVVITHFYSTGVLHPQLSRVVPNFVDYLVVKWMYGVPIFFVLSGFVIAYSQRDIRITPSFLGNFAVRRSLRLDPPYWAAIALTLLDNHVTRRFMMHPFPMYGPLTILGNMSYLQGILNQPIIVGPSWTLCFEVQFYLTLTILVGLAQSLPFARVRLWGWKNGSLILIFVPLAIISLYVTSPHRTINYVPACWWMFFLGVILWWNMSGMVSTPWVIGYMLIIAVFFCFRVNGYTLVSLLTGIAILIACRTGGLLTWLRWRWVQFFGTISYSMYLTHSLFVPLQLVGKRVFHDSIMGAWLTVGVAFGLSVATACIMYALLERIGLRLANRLKPRRMLFLDNVPEAIADAPVALPLVNV